MSFYNKARFIGRAANFPEVTEGEHPYARFVLEIIRTNDEGRAYVSMALNVHAYNGQVDVVKSQVKTGKFYLVEGRLIDRTIEYDGGKKKVVELVLTRIIPIPVSEGGEDLLYLNEVVLLGRSTRDCENRTTTNGKEVGNFAVAVNRGFGKDEGVDFFNCQYWDAVKTCQYIKKGTLLLIEGRLQSRKYTTKEGEERTVWEVIVNTARLCSGGGNGGAKVEETPPLENPFSGGSKKKESNPFGDNPFGDDDIPF